MASGEELAGTPVPRFLLVVLTGGTGQDPAHDQHRGEDQDRRLCLAAILHVPDLALLKRGTGTVFVFFFITLSSCSNILFFFFV